MASRNNLIAFVVFTGLLCLGLSVFLSSRPEKTPFAQRPLASLTPQSGHLAVFRKNMTVKEIPAQKTFIFALDTIETGVDGEASLEFDSGYRLRIPENALLTVTGSPDETTLILKKGDVQVESFGSEGSVFISKDGSRWTANDYELVYKKRQGDLTLPDVSANADASNIPAPQPKEGLSPDYIQDMLRAQRQNFFKCYAQLLQRNPGVTGQASLSFIIDRSGKIQQPEVASSSITDTVFRKCLLETLQRMEFKSFTGDPISTVFPLKFE